MIGSTSSPLHPDMPLHRVITLFGDHDVLDDALCAEFGRRGRRVHTVSVSTGWLNSATLAVVRPQTLAGASAMEQLANGNQPPAHVVAVCALPADTEAVDRIHELCRGCGVHHEVSLVWHPPLPEAAVARADSAVQRAEIPLGQLAAAVANTVDERSATETRPSFRSLTIPLA